MAITARNLIKNWFKTGNYPTESQFANWIDSFFHLSEDTLGISKIEGLQDALDSKAPVIIDENPNQEVTIDSYPDSVTIITADVSGFALVIIKVCLFHGSDAPVHEFHYLNDGTKLKRTISYPKDDLEGYSYNCTIVDGKLNLVLTFNTGPTSIIVKKPQLIYF